MAINTITIDTKQIDKLTKELQGFEKEVGKATCSALNRTIDHVITKAGQLVTKTYAVKSTEVKESFSSGIKRPSYSNLNASVTSKGHTLSFAHFPYTPKTPRRGQKSVFQSAVMINILKSKGKVLSRKGFVASTGAMDVDKTQFNVFKRLGKSRLPIAPIRTLSIPQMITNINVGQEIQKAAEQKLAERLEHEIIRQMTTMQNNIRR